MACCIIMIINVQLLTRHLSVDSIKERIAGGNFDVCRSCSKQRVWSFWDTRGANFLLFLWLHVPSRHPTPFPSFPPLLSTPIMLGNGRFLQCYLGRPCERFTTEQLREIENWKAQMKSSRELLLGQLCGWPHSMTSFLCNRTRKLRSCAAQFLHNFD